MRKNRLAAWTAVLLAAAWLAALSPAETVNWTAIRDVRIVPVNGPVIEKGTVLIRNGVIAAVGAQVDVPASAWILDGTGLTAYPGLIDALSSWGLPQAQAQAAPTAGRGAQPQPAGQQQAQQQPRSRGPAPPSAGGIRWWIEALPGVPDTRRPPGPKGGLPPRSDS